jgi:hypothetical protein
LGSSRPASVSPESPEIFHTLGLWTNAPSTGDLCGAIFVDQAFKKLVRLKFGGKWAKISPKSVERLMNDDWEHGIKRDFKDKDKDAKWSVQIPSETVAAVELKKSMRRANDQGYLEIDT